MAPESFFACGKCKFSRPPPPEWKGPENGALKHFYMWKMKVFAPSAGGGGPEWPLKALVHMESASFCAQRHLPGRGPQNGPGERFYTWIMQVSVPSATNQPAERERSEKKGKKNNRGKDDERGKSESS